jgi:hypothetical protein
LQEFEELTHGKGAGFLFSYYFRMHNEDEEAVTRRK